MDNNEIQPPFFFTDKNGFKIKDGAVVKMLHFKTKKRTYHNYQLIRFIEKYWVGIFLNADINTIPETYEGFKGLENFGYILPMTKQDDGTWKQVGIQLNDYEVLKTVLDYE